MRELDFKPEPVSPEKLHMLFQHIAACPKVPGRTKQTLIWFLNQTQGLSVPQWLMFRGEDNLQGKQIADEFRIISLKTKLNDFLITDVLGRNTFQPEVKKRDRMAGIASGYGFTENYSFLSFSPYECYPDKNDPHISPDFNAISQIQLLGLMPESHDARIITISQAYEAGGSAAPRPNIAG